MNYQDTFIRITRDSILKRAGEYTAPEYWVSLLQLIRLAKKNYYWRRHVKRSELGSQ
jgi:hypothetical protein